MGMAVLRQDEELGGRQLAGEALVFEKLRELTRSGYLPDPSTSDQGAGIRLCHPNAPDLILQPDGSIDLPLGQAAKDVRPPAAAAPPRMAKLRTLVIVILAATFWFLSLAFTASILEGM